MRSEFLVVIYIDESGDLGLSEKSSKYLVIAAIALPDPKKLGRIIKHMRTGKFKKQLYRAKEIKANSSNKDIIKHMINKLNQTENISLSIIVLEKKKLYSEYLKKDRNKLYNYVAGFIPSTLSIENHNVEVHIDRSKRKRVLREDFDKYFYSKLQKGTDRKITIQHDDSELYAGIQFADIIANVYFKKYEYKDSQLSDLITIKAEIKEMFNNY
jgi:hypothetical protein